MAGSDASNFLLDDMIYADVRNGWNHKLHSTSQQLSGLVPFVELYAVFDSDDIIFKNHAGWNGPKFSDIASRAIDVKFQYTTGSRISDDGTISSTTNEPFDFADRFQIAQNSKIVPIASAAKSQIESETPTYDSSYEGHAGVVDLTVARGASGPLNVKYDLNLTIPNPELINDLYEYSKLIILNSTFLLSYGWHPHDMDYPSGPTPLSRIRREESHGYSGSARKNENIIELNGANGGFYKTTLIRLYQFNFNLDNVGHLNGKLSFLTLAGNYLVSTRTAAISSTINKLLDGYDGMLLSDQHPNVNDLAMTGEDAAEVADYWVELGNEYFEQTTAYINAWEAQINLRRKIYAEYTDDGEVSAGKRAALNSRLERINLPLHRAQPGIGLGPEAKSEFTELQILKGETADGRPGDISGISVPDWWNPEKPPSIDKQREMEIDQWPSRGAAVGNLNGTPIMGMYVPAGDAGQPGSWRQMELFQPLNPQPAYPNLEDLPTERRAQIEEEWNNSTHNDPRGDTSNAQLLIQADEAAAEAVEVEFGDDYTDEDVPEIEYLTNLTKAELLDDRRVFIARRIKEAIEAGELEGQDKPEIVFYDGRGGRKKSNLKTLTFARWLIDKYTFEKQSTLGFLKIDNGLPWAQPDALDEAGLLKGFNLSVEEKENLTMLDTMPAYGRDLMRNIWAEFAKIGNPNRSRFFPINPDKTSRAFLGKRTVATGSSIPEQEYFLDEDTVKILKSSCAISTVLLEVVPAKEVEEEEVDEGLLASWFGDEEEMELTPQEQEEADLRELGMSEEMIANWAEDEKVVTVQDELRKLAALDAEQLDEESEDANTNPPAPGDDSADGEENEPKIIAHSKPVFYFLGAVLEALRMSMRDKIKFVYRDIPLEGEMSPSGFSLPIPQANAEKIKASKEKVKKLNEELKSFVEKVQAAAEYELNIPKKYLPGGDNYDALPKFAPGGSQPPSGASYARQQYNNALPRNQTADELSPADSKNKWGRRVANGTKKLPPGHEFVELASKEKHGNWDVNETEPDRRGHPMTPEELTAERQAMIDTISAEARLQDWIQRRGETVLSPIQCKNVFELPVEISVVRSILNDTNAPLHSMVSKILKACEKTTKVMRLSTRTYPSDESYLEVFVANIRVDGVTSEVFDSLNINSFLSSGELSRNSSRYGLTQQQIDVARSAPKDGYSSAAIAEARSATLGAYFSSRAVVCEFGTERSLVESFSLSSKVDPNAFSSFRLPDVVGGQTVDVAKIVRGNLLNSSMGLMGDIQKIIADGMLTGIEDLKALQIVDAEGKRVQTRNLQNFLMSETPSVSKAQTSFITQLMAHSQKFNTLVMSLQNAGLTGANPKGNDPKNNAFYGGVLSSYLRSISLTIHGTVGLGMFNVVYIKGLMRGIEGLYLITSVTENLTPGNFVTTLECKLIEYKDNTAKNPLAASPSLEEVADYARSGDTVVDGDFNRLFAETQTKIDENDGSSLLDI